MGAGRQPGRGGDVSLAAQVAIGAISGTSMDGIDVALIRSDGAGFVAPGPGATYPYPADVAAALRAVAMDPQMAAAPLEGLERAVTDSHVGAIERFMAQFAVDRANVALVGLHGQTVLHRPREAYSRQLCDGARAAAALKLDVVNDFRAADLKAGGEGAPLVPLYHAAMASTLPKPLMLLNWGGVGNVTWLGAKGEIIAFDSGPASALLDDFMLRRRGLAYDEGGALAAEGAADPSILESLMDDGFFARPAPKSLDRNHFHAAGARVDALGDADGAATLAAFTVEATVAALRRVPAPPSRWLVCGGGRRNLTLMRSLRARLGVAVDPIEDIGFAGDFVEAQCFAYLALRSRLGLPLSLPTTTGVPAPQRGGVFWPWR